MNRALPDNRVFSAVLLPARLPRTFAGNYWIHTFDLKATIRVPVLSFIDPLRRVHELT